MKPHPFPPLERTAGILAALLSPLIAFLVAAAPAEAHLNSISYSDIAIGEKEIEWELSFTLLCTLELFSVDADHDNFLSKEELRSAWPMMFYYLSNKVKVMNGGRQLRMNLKDIRFEVREDDSYTVFDLRFTFPQRRVPQTLFVCNVQEETDPYHRNLAEIALEDGTYMFVFNNMNYFDSANIPPYVEKLSGGTKAAGAVEPATAAAGAGDDSAEEAEGEF